MYTCPTCPKYNPEKTICTAPGHFKLPNGPFTLWKKDSIQLPPPCGYKYVLVMVCMFSHWTEAFPCRQATASSVAKVLLEKIIPIWGTPLKLHNDRSTHFTLLVRYFNQSALFGQFYSTFTALTRPLG